MTKLLTCLAVLTSGAVAAWIAIAIWLSNDEDDLPEVDYEEPAFV